MAAQRLIGAERATDNLPPISIFVAGASRELRTDRPIVSPMLALQRRREFIRTVEGSDCRVETTIFICNGYDA
jgi:hypothetical protein